MTFSEKNQKENLDLLFRLMMTELHDSPISTIFFDPTRDPFETVYQTTWKESVDQAWVDRLELCGRTHYRLRGAGWIEGLWRTGEFKGEVLGERMSRLSGVLKGYVKGRQYDVVLVFDELVQESGLPGGWVFNAIESSLLRNLWRTRDATWEERGTLVRIPLNFGMKLLDHMADIRAELEIVREELEAKKEELREFTCSFCGAPVVEQGPVPISEHAEGSFMAYACGRVETDAWGEQPCPSDPRFPKLEEYEFILREKPGETSSEWSCFANPKTPGARVLHLMVGTGRTQEEARQRVIEQYERISRPWRT